MLAVRLPATLEGKNIMVIRHPCNCSTCGAVHTLRISVGHNAYQEHTFDCGECSEEMTVGMNVDFVNVITSVKFIDNCEIGKKEGLIVNLHPELTVPADQIHADNAFPWLEHTHDIITAQNEHLGGDPNFKKLIEAQDSIGATHTPTEGWAIIKKSWSLFNNGRLDLALNNLESYKDLHYDSPLELNHVLFDFCTRLLGPIRYSIFKNSAELIEQIVKKYPDEYYKFNKYYTETLQADHLHKYFEVMTDYFRDYSEYSQTATFVQNGLPLPEDNKATSSAFKRTKMFYGNAFETLTSNISVLACLNNIHNGRAYNEFENMDLKKYMTINKANRGKPLSNTPQFYEFACNIDSTLRNASHHGAMNINKHSGIISYRSGGTGSLKRMPYSKFLFESNELYIRIISLLMLELAIAF
ncbi:hypothetical protein MNBD_GAMMA03-550 [hydrothermal vent metagenome]|uniref:Uncharacterized protein n=1 Tax=hydrothermal vent metagenome TaxID=652676 RepID=A0A3B0VP33_9ZZZZ